mmetsp:Transcript_48356/g.105264  ORF Transcript_48356/g.105264 Transcript_48356/m.105264 type:complete len:297 (-) Transcript_48356:510-1400(-)
MWLTLRLGVQGVGSSSHGLCYCRRSHPGYVSASMHYGVTEGLVRQFVPSLRSFQKKLFNFVSTQGDVVPGQCLAEFIKSEVQTVAGLHQLPLVPQFPRPSPAGKLQLRLQHTEDVVGLDGSPRPLHQLVVGTSASHCAQSLHFLLHSFFLLLWIHTSRRNLHDSTPEFLIRYSWAASSNLFEYSLSVNIFNGNVHAFQSSEKIGSCQLQAVSGFEQLPLLPILTRSTFAAVVQLVLQNFKDLVLRHCVLQRALGADLRQLRCAGSLHLVAQRILRVSDRHSRCRRLQHSIPKIMER